MITDNEAKLIQKQWPEAKKWPRVYDVRTDTMIEVTQEWCDDMAKSVNWLAGLCRAIKEVLEMKRPDDLIKEKENA